MEFRGWHQYGYAEFDGRFVLTGKFALTLTENCERPGTEDCLVLDLEPDPAVAARLPYYRNQSGGWINIREEGRLVRSIASPRQRAALVAGKIQSLTGRTSIVVDQLSTGIDCESASFWARFVAVGKVPKLARTNFNGGFGCGH